MHVTGTVLKQTSFCLRVLLGSWKRFTNFFKTQKVDIFSFLYFHPTIWLVCFYADVSKSPNCSCDQGFIKQNINGVISCLELQHPGIFSRRHIFRPSSTLQTEAGSFPPTTHTSRITPDQQPFPTSLATEGESAWRRRGCVLSRNGALPGSS